MQTVVIELTGRTPLLMHAVAQLANPRDPLSKEIRKLTSKRTKTDEDQENIARLEFEGGAYMNGHGPYVPAANLERCLFDAAKLTKQGQQIRRGLIVEEDSDLDYEGPRTVEELWAKGFHITLPVKVMGRTTMRCRPMFRDWAVTFSAVLDGEALDLADFVAICERAGRLVGLGDYRPRYGRFSVEVAAA